MFNIEFMQSPANTTQLLQPCDNDFNRAFQKAVQRTHEFLTTLTHLNFASIESRKKLKIADYRALTSSVVQRAFKNTGKWPMYFGFH